MFLNKEFKIDKDNYDVHIEVLSYESDEDVEFAILTINKNDKRVEYSELDEATQQKLIDLCCEEVVEKCKGDRNTIDEYLTNMHKNETLH